MKRSVCSRRNPSYQRIAGEAVREGENKRCQTQTPTTREEKEHGGQALCREEMEMALANCAGKSNWGGSAETYPLRVRVPKRTARHVTSPNRYREYAYSKETYGTVQ
jgi:hypothetical protein